MKVLKRFAIWVVSHFFMEVEPDLAPLYHPTIYNPQSRHPDYLDEYLPGISRGVQGDDFLAGYPSQSRHEEYLAGFPRRAGIRAGHCWRPPEIPNKLPVND